MSRDANKSRAGYRESTRLGSFPVSRVKENAGVQNKQSMKMTDTGFMHKLKKEEVGSCYLLTASPFSRPISAKTSARYRACFFVMP